MRIVHFYYMVIVRVLDPKNLLFLHDFGLIRQVLQILCEAREFYKLVEDILEVFAAVAVDLGHIFQDEIRTLLVT